MCKPASGVFTKGHKAYWSKYSDSHEIIIKAHGLCADGVRGSNIVRFGITPPNGDMTQPLGKWEYRLDDGMDTCLPEWYDAKEAEASARKMLKDWAAQKIASDDRELRDGEFWVIGRSKVTAYGSSKVTAYDSSKVTAYGSSTVTACDSSTVTACDRSKVTAYDGSKVTACDRSTVKACDSSTVTACDSSTVTACDSSTVTAYDSSKVTACDRSKVTACDSSKVTACEDNSTLITYIKIEKSVIHSANAVIVDRSVTPPKCYVGKQA